MQHYLYGDIQNWHASIENKSVLLTFPERKNVKLPLAFLERHAQNANLRAIIRRRLCHCERNAFCFHR